MSIGRHLVIVVLVILALRLVMESPLGITGRAEVLGVGLDATYVVAGLLTALCGAVIEAGRGGVNRLGFSAGSVNWGLLLTQGVAAALLAFIPPEQWVEWLGTGKLWEVLLAPTTRAIAGVWLGIVLVRALGEGRAAA